MRRSFRSIYTHEVERGRARFLPSAIVTEAELAALPPLVARYLRRAGVVGKPHVRMLQARMEGEMRIAPNAGWMKIHAEQTSFFDEPTRLFLIRGFRSGVPFEGLHAYVGASATMQIRVASLFDVADARGPEMNQTETVTFFNDMCALAPATLLRAPIEWAELDARRVRGTFTNAGNTIRAVLSFDDQGDLVDFVSEDRYQSADGKTYRRYPWRTPFSAYRDYHGVRLAERGDAIWCQPDGDFIYAHFRLLDVDCTDRSLRSAA